MLMRKAKRTYVQPTSEVVELHVTNQLLQSSFTGNRDNPYGEPTDPWPSN